MGGGGQGWGFGGKYIVTNFREGASIVSQFPEGTPPSPTPFPLHALQSEMCICKYNKVTLLCLNPSMPTIPTYYLQYLYTMTLYTLHKHSRQNAMQCTTAYIITAPYTLPKMHSNTWLLSELSYNNSNVIWHRYSYTYNITGIIIAQRIMVIVIINY